MTQEVILYYDPKSEHILDFIPRNITLKHEQTIRELWSQPICREILKFLAKHEKTTAPAIKEHIGHSMSTLHDSIKKLEMGKLIKTTMIYEGNRQKIIEPTLLCVSKNDKLTENITKFLNQGLWIDTKRSNIIIDFLNAHPKQYFSAEQISIKTGIQVDEVQTLLDNWDSLITRSFSQFFKKRPFEKKVMYKSIR
ncbi:MAG: winged helix-turn-helix domain-containing protein [Candidatus Woesearchaeota archaeon]